MSTIQIPKNWNPTPEQNMVEALPDKMEVDFFPDGHNLPKNEFTAEDLMGLSWVLFEDEWSDA